MGCVKRMQVTSRAFGPTDRPEMPSRMQRASPCGYGRRRKLGFVVSVLVVLSFVSPTLTLSEEAESKEADPFFRQRGIDDRAAFFIGGISSSVETTGQVNSEAGIGTTLLLERIFDLPRHRDYLRFGGYYRFSRRHRIDFRYLAVSGSGTTTLLDEKIVVGPLTFELGAEIGAIQETRFGAVEYRYSFVNTGRAEAGLSVGLGIIDVDLEVFGEIGVSPGPVFTASERVNETIPLPLAGVYTDFTLTRRLFFSVAGTLFSANYDEYSGDVSDVRAALRWYPAKYFGFGVAYNRTRLDIVVQRSRGNISLDYRFEGPSVFISFLVPGLR